MELKKWNINDTPEITIPEMNENLDLIQEELRKAQVVKQLDNLIVNGDFSDGTNGWVSDSSNSIVNDNILTNTANGTSLYGRINQFNVDLKPLKDEKIYYNYKVRPLNNDIESLKILLRNDTSSLLYEVPFTGFVNGQVKTISDVQLITADFTLGLRVYLTHHYGSVEIANGKSVEFSEVSIVNLTQTFGAGNEPSKEFCDAIMEVVGYFNGQYNLTIQEMFTIIAKWSQAQNVNSIMTLPNFDETE